MPVLTLNSFVEIVCLDFEFQAPPGELPRPVCLVAKELRSGNLHRIWLDGEAWPKEPPFAHGPSVLWVAFFGSAELACYLVLGWPFPVWLVDVYVEFRVLTNGFPVNSSLLGALEYFGIGGMSADQKEDYRQRILAGGPFSAEEQRLILDYCMRDVIATEHLLARTIASDSVLTGALLRGEYMKVVAQMEHTGVPLDAELYRSMVEHWNQLQTRVIDRVNHLIPVFEGRNFRIARFEDWLADRKLLDDWPRTESGRIALDDDVFRDQASLHSELEPLRLVRQMLGQLHHPGLFVGTDGRNRCLLSPYRTKTSRNAPSTARFIFAAPSFLRGLIRPEPGQALAYIDWSQQEFGAAAALSGDTNMMESYCSGDPYLTFAKLAGAVPPDATEASHPSERRLFKTVILGVQYLISAAGLANRLGVALSQAQDLLNHHHRIYARFWAWSDAVSDWGQLYGEISTVFGWPLRMTTSTSLRTLRNFPLQANASEMLRLACILASRAGVVIAAPVHDALVVLAPANEIQHAVAQTQAAMRRASEIVLAGFALRTDVQVIHYPERFREKRGVLMWRWITETLSAIEKSPHHRDSVD
jgi:hypothetical protein